MATTTKEGLPLFAKSNEIKTAKDIALWLRNFERIEGFDIHFPVCTYLHSVEEEGQEETIFTNDQCARLDQLRRHCLNLAQEEGWNIQAMAAEVHGRQRPYIPAKYYHQDDDGSRTFYPSMPDNAYALAGLHEPHKAGTIYVYLNNALHPLISVISDKQVYMPQHAGQTFDGKRWR